MAQLTFFNPDTGEKLGEAKGTVRWDNPQADPVQQLIDMQERMMKRDEQPKGFTAEGQATVHISRRKWKRLKRAFTMQRPRIPRKLKKAARHIHIEIVNENFNVVEPFSKGGSDVNLQVDVDYRIRVDGRRTRSVERMVAKARWMLSKAYRDMVQHHIDEMKKACKPGMLTYEPPVVPEMLVPSEETAEQIRRDDIHLHLCHDCPHWQDGDEGPQCEYPDCPPCNDNS